ncbi:2-hydroxy-3-keto-5-methylthiopentenyl-1-phosphate phosphatase [Alkalihalobacillus sp. LMS39]|uniref:2-hydroxy-3-keto-5-methylthiopentenyl-1- phosphate phosphatase n=1 Tax=Alkalihalobacillus sp. LMS39 TaxID=2924032 RepID=UPI001FB3C039|nr:2-hydroxy-3-keto-5-methylthiopentenyl-1-phosphate phosphatase [Alkalihalobacillus sp. LMS39]UOE94340.1 2-hydroxy-3-keto-5-methylthiopentenyl-1-phosphate phosphatase [Alkalihalobacillus sp. LMS39]
MPKHSTYGELENKEIVIFCDFDGTITNNDNIIEIMKKFAPPEWLLIVEEILAKKKSLQDGVGEMFALLPTSQKDDIINFTLEQAEIRNGFEDFVQFTSDKGIELNVVSGGIDFFVEPLLEKYPLPIYCNEANFSSDTIKIEWPHPCDEYCQNECGCCKPSIIRKLSKGKFRIVIGDSISDLQAAKQADLVIARDYLLAECKQLQLPYQPFESFYDVIDILKQIEVTS